MANKRNQTLGEELANAISHGTGALLSIIGMILMIIKAKTAAAIVGVVIFGTTAIILYVMSTLYHSFRSESTTKKVFHRFDHSSIYLLIGGTYLPIYLIVFKYPINIVYIAIQWAVIITGITLKGAQFKKFKTIHFILYIILGWSGIVVFRPIWQTSRAAFYWILAGGISYTIGTIFYGLSKYKYNHFVWHLFVLAGTILHFFAIYLNLL
ncbi:MAG: hemolysin III family protein [Acholeplasmataceae bacterium]|jgi:hemolysin III|nr:hemolysin III family protein [Acholeplasmataceae bacterium]